MEPPTIVLLTPHSIPISHPYTPPPHPYTPIHGSCPTGVASEALKASGKEVTKQSQSEVPLPGQCRSSHPTSCCAPCPQEPHVPSTVRASPGAPSRRWGGRELQGGEGHTARTGPWQLSPAGRRGLTHDMTCDPNQTPAPPVSSPWAPLGTDTVHFRV